MLVDIKEHKDIAGRYDQLFSGHAVTGAYLAEKIGKIQSSECCDASAKRDRPAATFPPSARAGSPQKRDEERWEGMWVEQSVSPFH